MNKPGKDSRVLSVRMKTSLIRDAKAFILRQPGENSGGNFSALVSLALRDFIRRRSNGRRQSNVPI